MNNLEPAFGLSALPSFEVISEALVVLDILELHFLPSPAAGQDCIFWDVSTIEFSQEVRGSVKQSHILVLAAYSMSPSAQSGRRRSLAKICRCCVCICAVHSDLQQKRKA